MLNHLLSQTSPAALAALEAAPDPAPDEYAYVWAVSPTLRAVCHVRAWDHTVEAVYVGSVNVIDMLGEDALAEISEDARVVREAQEYYA